MKIFAILFFGIPLFALSARADSTCPNFTGHYTNWFGTQWVMKATLAQTGCDHFYSHFVDPAGDSFDINAVLDGVPHVTRDDPSTKTLDYETYRIAADGIWYDGSSYTAGVLQKTWKGHNYLDAAGSYVQWLEEFDANQVSQGPTNFVFRKN